MYTSSKGTVYYANYMRIARGQESQNACRKLLHVCMVYIAHRGLFAVLIMTCRFCTCTCMWCCVVAFFSGLLAWLN